MRTRIGKLGRIAVLSSLAGIGAAPWAHAIDISSSVKHDPNVSTLCGFHMSFQPSWAYPPGGACSDSKDQFAQLVKESACLCASAAGARTLPSAGPAGPVAAPVAAAPAAPSPEQAQALEAKLDEVANGCHQQHPSWAPDSHCMSSCVQQSPAGQEMLTLIASMNQTNAQLTPPAAPVAQAPANAPDVDYDPDGIGRDTCIPTFRDRNSLLQALQSEEQKYRDFPMPSAGGGQGCDDNRMGGQIQRLRREISFMIKHVQEGGNLQGFPQQSAPAPVSAPVLARTDNQGPPPGYQPAPVPAQYPAPLSPPPTAQIPPQMQPVPLQAQPPQPDQPLAPQPAPVQPPAPPQSGPQFDPSSGYAKQVDSQDPNQTNYLVHLQDNPALKNYNHGAVVCSCKPDPRDPQHPNCQGYLVTPGEARNADVEQLLHLKRQNASPQDAQASQMLGQAVQQHLGDLPNTTPIAPDGPVQRPGVDRSPLPTPPSSPSPSAGDSLDATMQRMRRQAHDQPATAPAVTPPSSDDHTADLDATMKRLRQHADTPPAPSSHSNPAPSAPAKKPAAVKHPATTGVVWQNKAPMEGQAGERRNFVVSLKDGSLVAGYSIHGAVYGTRIPISSLPTRASRQKLVDSTDAMDEFIAEHGGSRPQPKTLVKPPVVRLHPAELYHPVTPENDDVSLSPSDDSHSSTSVRLGSPKPKAPPSPKPVRAPISTSDDQSGIYFNPNAGN